MTQNPLVSLPIKDLEIEIMFHSGPNVPLGGHALFTSWDRKVNKFVYLSIPGKGIKLIGKKQKSARNLERHVPHCGVVLGTHVC